MNLVFVHGVAAAGKLTTARALEDEIGYPVFHNHLVVDMLMTVFPFGSDPFIELREEFWLSVFDRAARTGRSLTFTFAPEATVRAGFSERVVSAVARHGGTVRFVRLVVDRDEQERRLIDPSRREFHKLTDVDMLRQLRAQAADQEIEKPPTDLEIDMMTSTPAESARAIASHFGLTREVGSERHQPLVEPYVLGLSGGSERPKT